jgi:sugar lactone lactonase YvrE
MQFSLDAIDYAVPGVYFAFVAGIGWLLRRRVRVLRGSVMRRPWLASVCVVAVTVALVRAQAPPTAPRETRDAIIAQLRAAHAARDAKGFLEGSQKLVALLPRSTRALVTLASAQAMNGDAVAAARLIDRLTRMGVALDVRADPDFDPVRQAPAFQAAVARARALDARIGSSTIAFRLDAPELALEGIAYDPTSRAFFVTSQRQRKVLRRAADGRVSDFTRPTDGLLAAVAVAVDAPRRRLWLTTADIKNSTSFLVEYDVDTGARLRRIEPPAGLARSLLSDIAVNARGDVFVADPIAGRLYVLRHGAAALVVLTDTGAIVSAQGIAPSDDGRFLFVADYAQGIVRVDQETGAAVLLPVPDDTAPTDVDGLVLHGRDLIGIQNGFEPHRVARFRLDAARERITTIETLERRHPDFDEPTLGVLVDHALYYVANSRAGRADTAVTAAGATATTGPAQRAPAILRLALPRDR